MELAGDANNSCRVIRSSRIGKITSFVVGGQNWHVPRPTGLTGWADRSGRSGPIIRVGLGFCVKSPIVIRFGRGTSSPTYKYKGCGRLRVSNHNLIKNYSLYSISQTLTFPTPLLFFAHLYGVQGRLEWPADLKATLDLQAPMGSLPSLRF